MNNYTDMTDEEYDALDEELTRNPPRIISNGNDWLSLREIRIDELISKEIAAAATDDAASA